MTQLPTLREAVLLGCIAGQRRYGRELRAAYEQKVGAPISIGALYETLADLEKRGWVKCAIGKETHERGGNRRKYYTIRRSGNKALLRFVRTVQARPEEES